MKKISIIEVTLKKGVTLKAIEIDSSMQHVSPCCTDFYRKFYCQNRIAEQSWSHKTDASGDVIFNKRLTILNDYIVIPEFDRILEVVEDMNINNLQY